MKNNATPIIIIGVLILANIVIGLIDVGANIISTVPVAGDAAETASESVLETLQVIINALGSLGVLATARRRS